MIHRASLMLLLASLVLRCALIGCEEVCETKCNIRRCAGSLLIVLLKRSNYQNIIKFLEILVMQRLKLLYKNYNYCWFGNPVWLPVRLGYFHRLVKHTKVQGSFVSAGGQLCSHQKWTGPEFVWKWTCLFDSNRSLHVCIHTWEKKKKRSRLSREMNSGPF